MNKFIVNILLQTDYHDKPVELIDFATEKLSHFPGLTHMDDVKMLLSLCNMTEYNYIILLHQ